MSIFDNLPYANYHDLNADWIIEELQKIATELADYEQTTNARLDALEAQENGGV